MEVAQMSAFEIFWCISIIVLAVAFGWAVAPLFRRRATRPAPGWQSGGAPFDPIAELRKRLPCAPADHWWELTIDRDENYRMILRVALRTYHRATIEDIATRGSRLVAYRQVDLTAHASNEFRALNHMLPTLMPYVAFDEIVTKNTAWAQQQVEIYGMPGTDGPLHHEVII
jgi:hypothetical protein